jgi:hypothetical protein
VGCISFVPYARAYLVSKRLTPSVSMQGQCQRLRVPAAWRQFLTTLQQTEWVVYAKPPLPGPQRVLRYLARYTHRVAITNRRLLACDDGQVTFRWKDYQRGNRQRLMTLDAVEFIRRFLLHVLPRGFQRMRHYGFFANGQRKGKLPRCRELLGQALLAPAETSPAVDAIATASTPPPALRHVPYAAWGGCRSRKRGSPSAPRGTSRVPCSSMTRRKGGGKLAARSRSPTSFHAA